MNAKLVPILLFAAASLSAQAGQSPAGDQYTTTLKPISTVAPKPIHGQRAIDLLALETDLTPRLVRMVVSHRKNVPYDFRFERHAARQFQASLGEERYSNLKAGRPIELYSMQVREAARATASASGRRAPSVLVAAAD